MNLVRYLKTGEVAALLHVDPRTVRRWAQDGRLPCKRTIGKDKGHRRYPELEIRQIAESMETP
jgi:excisionase family DNA binding protein